MKHPKRALFVLLVVPLFLFMSAEEGHGGSGAVDFAGKVVNFLILFGGLAFVLAKPVREMLGKRGSDIREDLAAAEGRRGEAEKKSAETAARLGGLDGEIGRLKEEAEEEARRTGERIGRAAEAEAEKIRRFAEQEIDEQVRSGVRALKSYAAEAAASLARERIRKKLTPGDQAALIDKSIEKLTELHEKPGPRQ
jgi:F0F1-type ATP synthase membrane subunit b/b'